MKSPTTSSKPVSAWKLSIKPAAESERDAFTWCCDRGIVGVGWSYAYEQSSAPNLERLRRDNGGVLPAAVRTLAYGVDEGDFVWLHRNGKFFLARIQSKTLLLGPELGPEFRAYDIGHAREADWVEVPHSMVPGAVERSLIVSRTLQRIESPPHLLRFFEHLHKELAADSTWRPHLGDHDFAILIQDIPPTDLERLLTPDDWEDLLAGYFQTHGWTLVKSSCFRSKPRYEFQMLRTSPHRQIGLVQAKSGDVTLDPWDYASDATEFNQVFLFASAGIRCDRGFPDNVSIVSRDMLIDWMTTHPGLLTDSVRLRLALGSTIA